MALKVSSEVGVLNLLKSWKGFRGMLGLMILMGGEVDVWIFSKSQGKKDACIRARQEYAYRAICSA